MLSTWRRPATVATCVAAGIGGLVYVGYASGMIRRYTVKWFSDSPSSSSSTVSRNTSDNTTVTGSRRGPSPGHKGKLDVDYLSSVLQTRSLGRRVKVYDTVDSTMRWAVDIKNQEGPPSHGTLVIAEEQTQGRGRGGRNWDSSRRFSNVYMSFIWWCKEGMTPVQRIQEMSMLNLVLALAVARACQGQGVLNTQVKWPNDVWAGDKKLCGVLLDYDGLQAAVAGIGINVNMGDDDLPEQVRTEATSMQQQLGQPVVREALIATVCNEIESLMSMDFVQMLHTYNQYDLLRGRRVRVHHRRRGQDDERDYTGVCHGLSQSGALRVRPDDGTAVRELAGEEITVLPPEQ